MEVVALGFCECKEIFHTGADTEGCWQLPDTVKQHEDEGMMTGNSSGKCSPSSPGAQHASNPCRGNSSTTRPHSECVVVAPASLATLTTGTWEM